MDKPPGHEMSIEFRTKVFILVNKSVLSHLTFYLESDDPKPVDFNGKRYPLLVNCKYSN